MPAVEKLSSSGSGSNRGWERGSSEVAKDNSVLKGCSSSNTLTWPTSAGLLLFSFRETDNAIKV